MLTAQQIFDKVVTHLFTQGRQSVNEARETCAYRGDEGAMCAVGCLIPDSQYRPEFDNDELLRDQIRVDNNLWTAGFWFEDCDSTGVAQLRYYKPFVDALAEGGVDVSKHADLLMFLQRVHDYSGSISTAEVLRRLRLTTEAFNLDASIIDRVEVKWATK